MNDVRDLVLPNRPPNPGELGYVPLHEADLAHFLFRQDQP
jgi:hypothetical protein